MDKKKIIAIILFILLGLFIFTFANPGPSELDPVEVPGQGEVDDDESDDEQLDLDENDDEETEDDETDRPVVEVDEAPIIEINPRSVTILLGQNYNVMTGVRATDDNDVVRVTASITDTTKLEVGTHTITYTTSDTAGHTTTATRTIIVLDPIGDEDNDGYTNEEEIENGTNPSDGEEYPEYSKNPTIDFSSCATSMTVYDELINFEECIKVTDEFYGTEGVTSAVTTDINPNQFGNYTVTIVAKDILGNETTETFDFEVLKRDVTVTIDNVEANYKDEVKPLTSNALEMAYNENDIGVVLSTEVTNTTPVGEYAITGTWTNENYNVTFVDGVYSITAKALTEEDIKELGITFENDSFVYDGESHSISVTNLPEGFDVSYTNNDKVNVDVYEVVATVTGNENYTGTVELKATMTITAKEVSVVWEGSTFTYNGTKQLPTATAEGVEITVNVKEGNSIDAGSYTAVASTTDKNYKLANTEYNYEITKATPSYTVPTDLEAEEGQTLGDIELPEGFTFEEDLDTVLEEGEYKKPVTYTPEDTKNYEEVKGIEVIITVKPVQYTVTFVNWDGQTLKTQTVKKGESAVAPNSPSRNNWTFTGWDKDFTNVQENLVITAQYKANQTGIEVVEKPNVQFQFQKGTTPDFTKLITVYEVYADGSKVETTNYTTDVDTSKVVDNKVLTIKQNGFTNTDIEYSVINEVAYQSKFEVDFTGLNYYYETKSEYCSSDCDSQRNTNKVETDYTFLEIVEHYDENISISNVRVKYTNGSIEDLIVSDSIRWTHKSGGSKYNPVYIATTSRTKTITEEYESCHWEWFNRVCETKYRDVVVTDDIMTDEYTIDTIEITYNRTGYGKYTVYFKYDENTNEFTPYDEIKIS